MPTTAEPQGYSRRSFLTTGPFLQVRAEGQAGPGEEVRANGHVTLEVKVQCTDWIDIDRVQVLVNGRAHKELNFTRASHANWFADGAVKFERTAATDSAGTSRYCQSRTLSCAAARK